MKLLLDTHVLLWWLGDDRRLGTKVVDLIADSRNEVLVSIASLWEIVVKQRIGKLDVDLAAVTRVMAQQDLAILTVTPAHLAVLAGLPMFNDHRDPFDHLLVAQAVGESAHLVSADRNMVRYAVPIIPPSD